MRTRETIESELIYYAKRASVSGDTSEYQEYINRMQLDLMMDLRDLLTPPHLHVTRLTPSQLDTLNTPRT